MNPTHLIIKSQDRTNYSESPSNFQIKLDSKIDLKKCTRMKLVSAMIGNTFYNINSTNNSFDINGTTYTIPSGSYTLDELLQAMVLLLNGTYPNMTIAYNSVTSLITISNDANFTMNLQLSNFYKVIGFEYLTYNGSSNYTGIFNPTIDTLAIYINLDIGSHVQSSNAYKPTFVIFNNVNKNNYIMYNDKTHYEHYHPIQGSLLNTINIELRDDKNRLLEGVSEWIMILAFE